jgi:hypothetical protein
VKARHHCWLLMLACSGPAPLATLIQLEGHVERDSAAAVDAWQAASVGATFVLGDGVRTLPDASARLELDDTTRLDLGAATTVRFSPTRPAPHIHAFDVEAGAASIEAGAEPVSIQTRVGLARVERDSSVRFVPSTGGLRFEVRVGRAAFGASEALVAGARVTIDDSGAVSPGDGDSRDALNRANLVLADPTGTITATVKGRGASLRTAGGWAPLAEGSSHLIVGAELETSASSSIEIERDGEHALLGENGRYVLGSAGGVLVNARRGTVLAGGRREVRVEVPGGVIRVPAMGQAFLRVSEEETQLTARALEVVVEAGERRQGLAPGHSARLGKDGRLRPSSRPESQTDGAGDAVDQALDYADFVLASGTTATIHDPSPPTAVRFDFGSACTGMGSIELSFSGRRMRRGSGEGSVALSVPKGNHRYELRCGSAGKRVLGGQITVIEDAATRSIASKPPRTALSADGRKYTVLYQNRLPEITLSWPNPPAGGNLRLIHQHRGNETALASSEPRYDFASGQLAEGHHGFYFDGGGSVSRQTTVDIVFDNAAPRASLLLAPVLTQRPGESVAIAGTALPGSEVYVDGARVPIDARGRFSASAALPVVQHALAIKLVQPGRGTHYYLRRGQRP